MKSTILPLIIVGFVYLLTSCKVVEQRMETIDLIRSYKKALSSQLEQADRNFEEQWKKIPDDVGEEEKKQMQERFAKEFEEAKKLISKLERYEQELQKKKKSILEGKIDSLSMKENLEKMNSEVNITLQNIAFYKTFSIQKGMVANAAFDHAKDILKSAGQQNIKALIDAMVTSISTGTSVPNTGGMPVGSLLHHNIRVYGYTDATGSPETNQDLSERRAESVKKYMQNYMTQRNIAYTFKEVLGFGEDKCPQEADCNDGGNRNPERRVVWIYVIPIF